MKILKNLITITAALAGIIGVLALILVLAGFRPFILKSESMEPIYTKVNGSYMLGIGKLTVPPGKMPIGTYTVPSAFVSTFIICFSNTL